MFVLIFALGFSRSSIKGKDFFRTMLVSPSIISVIGVRTLWSLIYNSHWGLLDGFLRTIKLDNLALNWLTTPDKAIS